MIMTSAFVKAVDASDPVPLGFLLGIDLYPDHHGNIGNMTNSR